MYRLFRDATRYEDGHHIKDLDCINRDLSKVIVIDWNEKSVKSHPRNALKMKEWKGNDDDRYLIDLALLLKSNYYEKYCLLVVQKNFLLVKKSKF